MMIFVQICSFWRKQNNSVRRILQMAIINIKWSWINYDYSLPNIHRSQWYFYDIFTYTVFISYEIWTENHYGKYTKTFSGYSFLIERFYTLPYRVDVRIWRFYWLNVFSRSFITILLQNVTAASDTVVLQWFVYSVMIRWIHFLRIAQYNITF